MTTSSETFRESEGSLSQGDRERFLSDFIQHDYVESENSLHSTMELPRNRLQIRGFTPSADAHDPVEAQWLSGNRRTHESTQRVYIPKGWKAPIGSFNNDIEVYVLQGDLRQGGFPLRSDTYSFIPAGIPTGPWEARQDTVLLWMPDGYLEYDHDSFAHLPQTPGSALLHTLTQSGPRYREYVPARDIHAMQWENTTFLPPGSARKSLYKHPQTERATWVLGVVPGWYEGNFLAGHPTTEEAYMLTGDIHGFWCMHDDPFNRRFSAMLKDGYYWRPAHVPHGPFRSKTGGLLLVRTRTRLDCNWILHSTDLDQLNPID